MIDFTPTSPVEVVLCVVDDCGSPSRTRGWCQKHYQRWLKYDDPKGFAPRPSHKTCFSCGIHKPVEDYELRKDHPGKNYRYRRNVCDPCRLAQAVANRRTRRNALREKINAIKIASGCVDCGYRESVYALEFDHLPGHVKVQTIAYMVMNTWHWEKIEAEIAKCDVRCANCHAIITEERRK